MMAFYLFNTIATCWYNPEKLHADGKALKNFSFVSMTPAAIWNRTEGEYSSWICNSWSNSSSRRCVSEMSMNFVTFNQDYSHLAVGANWCTFGGGIPLPDSNLWLLRYLQRFPDIHYRSLYKMLRNEAGWHCASGDALFDIFSSTHPFPSEAANKKYQSMFGSHWTQMAAEWFV